jgi:hypothetical protein
MKYSENQNGDEDGHDPAFIGPPNDETLESPMAEICLSKKEWDQGMATVLEVGLNTIGLDGVWCPW